MRVRSALFGLALGLLVLDLRPSLEAQQGASGRPAAASALDRGSVSTDAQGTRCWRNCIDCV